MVTLPPSQNTFKEPCFPSFKFLLLVPLFHQRVFGTNEQTRTGSTMDLVGRACLLLARIYVDSSVVLFSEKGMTPVDC